MLSGNEKTDFLAKRVVQLPPVNDGALPLQEYVHSIRRSILVCKLAQSKPSLGSCSCSERCRRLEVSLSRLRIGHTRLTHGNLMDCEDTPVCGGDQVLLSVFHVLVECLANSVPRNRFFPSLMSVLLRERLALPHSSSPTFSSSTLFAF